MAETTESRQTSENAGTDEPPAGATVQQAEVRPDEVEPNSWADIANTIGYVLGVSYPVLALSTGVRAVYQLAGFKEGASTTAAVLSLVASSCYLAASIGFFKRERWAWWLSVCTLGFEMSMVLLIGSLTTINPDIFGDETVWSRYGMGYGFFPLIQPLLGLIWLLRPMTLDGYGIRRRT